MDTRRNLNCLQVNAKHFNSVSKQKSSIKDHFQSSENENKINNLICKTTQVNLEAWISDDDLANEVPTENYWKTTAEKRRIALEEALTENERLWKEHEELTQVVAQHKELLDEANTFIEVFKELVQEQGSANDTGIDVDDSIFISSEISS